MPAANRRTRATAQYRSDLRSLYRAGTRRNSQVSTPTRSTCRPIQNRSHPPTNRPDSTQSDQAEEQEPASALEPEPATPEIREQATRQQGEPASDTTEPEPARESKRKRQTEKQGAQSISLRWRSNAYTVSDEGYKKIDALIKAYATCHRCEQYYTDEASNIAGNLCLECFYEWSSRNSDLTYIGPEEPNQDGTPEYRFLDQRGIVYVSLPGPGHEETARESYAETLKYWSFPVRQYIEKDGRHIETRSGRWNIYGNPRKGIVIAHVWETYPDKADALFLLSKTGNVTQINKRKASHRQLFIEAKKRLEASKKNGQYFIDGEGYNYIHEWHEYCMIAHMLNENPRLWP